MTPEESGVGVRHARAELDDNLFGFEVWVLERGMGVKALSHSTRNREASKGGTGCRLAVDSVVPCPGKRQRWPCRTPASGLAGCGSWQDMATVGRIWRRLAKDRVSVGIGCYIEKESN